MSDELNIDSSFAHPGATHYMEAPALRRGLRMPARIKLIIAALGAAALLIAALFGFGFYRNITEAPQRYAQGIYDAIHNGAGLELPKLSSFVGSDNESIRNSLAEAGYKLIDIDKEYADEEDLDEHSIDLVKVPADIEYAKASEMYKKSLRRTPVTEAAHFLAGTWRFTSYDANGVDLKVKYADFNSETIEDAIFSAIALQGWAESTMGESGIDESGNTYQSGSIQIDEQTYRWTVSACPLDEVYSVNGLPENAFYVGARLVQ